MFPRKNRQIATLFMFSVSDRCIFTRKCRFTVIFNGKIISQKNRQIATFMMFWFNGRCIFTRKISKKNNFFTEKQIHKKFVKLQHFRWPMNFHEKNLFYWSFKKWEFFRENEMFTLDFWCKNGMNHSFWRKYWRKLKCHRICY